MGNRGSPKLCSPCLSHWVLFPGRASSTLILWLYGPLLVRVAGWMLPFRSLSYWHKREETQKGDRPLTASWLSSMPPPLSPKTHRRPYHGRQACRDNPGVARQRSFFLLAVLPSIRLGLIDVQDLTLSGNGTALVSHAFPYCRHLSSCTFSCPCRNTCGLP